MKVNITDTKIIALKEENGTSGLKAIKSMLEENCKKMS